MKSKIITIMKLAICLMCAVCAVKALIYVTRPKPVTEPEPLVINEPEKVNKGLLTVIDEDREVLFQYEGYIRDWYSEVEGKKYIIVYTKDAEVLK